MDDSFQYLIHFLENEFRHLSDIVIRPTFPSGTQRSVDLPQDYDPESATLHRTSGVTVRTKRREFYFPAEWARVKDYASIQKLADQIRESVEEG